MPSPRLLSRPERNPGSGIPKWPFFLVGAGFIALMTLGNILVDRAVPQQGEIPTRTTTEPLEVSLEVPENAASYPSEWAIYFDPTLMVLPNEHSYSKAYLTRIPQRPAASVDLAIPSVPFEFKRPYFRAGGIVSPTKAGSWAKQDPNVLVSAGLTATPEESAFSALGVYGELQNRSILAAPDFPKVTRTELLTPTEITVATDASGAIRMVLLARSSGDDETDALGMKLARQVSFAPLPSQGDRLSWGQLKVFWAVELKPTRL